MPQTLDYSNAPPIRHSSTGPSVGGIFLFWLLYPLASFVVYAQIPINDGIHQSFFGHTPGPDSMLRYGIGWECFTIAVIVAYLLWLRRYRRAWLLAPVLGVLAFLPGIIACCVRLH